MCFHFGGFIGDFSVVCKLKVWFIICLARFRVLGKTAVPAYCALQIVWLNGNCATYHDHQFLRRASMVPHRWHQCLCLFVACLFVLSVCEHMSVCVRHSTLLFSLLAPFISLLYKIFPFCSIQCAPLLTQSQFVGCLSVSISFARTLYCLLCHVCLDGCPCLSPFSILIVQAPQWREFTSVRCCCRSSSPLLWFFSVN